MALRQYLALPTQEMRPGAAANWARTTKERAAVPKLPGSVAILPGSAARVPTATPLLAAAAAGLARQTGGPARASVEMRGPSSNSATMGLTAQQRAVAKTSSRTPSPGHRPPVPVGQGRGAVHRLTTGPGFLPTSQATVRQSWPDAQPGEVVSREQPRLPRHHELGLTPSPLVPGGVRPAHVRAGRVRVGRGGPTSAIRTGGRLPSRGSSAMVPVADAVSAGRMGAGLPRTTKESVAVPQLPGSVGMLLGRAAHLPAATPLFVTAGVHSWPATQRDLAMRPGRPRLLPRHDLGPTPDPPVPGDVLGREARHPIATSPGVRPARTPAEAASLSRSRTGLPNTGLPSTGRPSTGLISVGPTPVRRTTTGLMGVRSSGPAPMPSFMSSSPQGMGATSAGPKSAGLANASLKRARVVGAAPTANVTSAGPTSPGLTGAARREAGLAGVGSVAAALIGVARRNAGLTSARTANAGRERRLR